MDTDDVAEGFDGNLSGRRRGPIRRLNEAIRRRERERLSPTGFPEGFWRSPEEKPKLTTWRQIIGRGFSLEELLGEKSQYDFVAYVEYPKGGRTRKQRVSVVVTDRAVAIVRLESGENAAFRVQVLERLPRDLFFGDLHKDPTRRWQSHYVVFGEKRYRISRRAYRRAQSQDAMLVAESGASPHFPPPQE